MHHFKVRTRNTLKDIHCNLLARFTLFTNTQPLLLSGVTGLMPAAQFRGPTLTLYATLHMLSVLMCRSPSCCRMFMLVYFMSMLSAISVHSLRDPLPFRFFVALVPLLPQWLSLCQSPEVPLRRGTSKYAMPLVTSRRRTRSI